MSSNKIDDGQRDESRSFVMNESSKSLSTTLTSSSKDSLTEPRPPAVESLLVSSRSAAAEDQPKVHSAKEAAECANVRERLQQEAPTGAQGSTKHSRKSTLPHPCHGVLKARTTPGSPPAESQPGPSQYSDTGPPSTLKQGSGGALAQRVSAKATRPPPTDLLEQECGSPAQSVYGAAQALETGQRAEPVNRGNTAARRTPTPAQAVCRILVPCFTGEDDYLAAYLTGRRKSAARLNQPSPNEMDSPPTTQIAHEEVSGATVLQLTLSSEFPTTRTERTPSRTSIHVRGVTPPLTAEHDHLQQVRAEGVHHSDERPNATITVSGSSNNTQQSQSFLTAPPSLLRLASMGVKDARENPNKEKGKTLLPATDSFCLLPRATCQNVGQHTFMSVLNAPERSRRLIRTPSTETKLSRSSSIGRWLPEQSSVTGTDSKGSTPSLTPTPSGGSSPECHSISGRRPRGRFAGTWMREPWCTVRQPMSQMSRAARNTSSASTPATTISMHDSSYCIAGRGVAAIHPACIKASRNVISTPLASSTTQRFSSDHSVKKLLKSHPTSAISSGLLLAATLAAFLLLLRSIIGPDTRERSNSAAACRSELCFIYGRLLADAVNTSLNPCESFTRFVCDGWRRRNRLSVREDAFRFELHRMSYLLRSMPVPHKAQNALERAAAFYRSCDAVRIGDADELPKVKAALLRAGIVWPRVPSESQPVDLLRTWLYVALKLHWSSLLDLAIVLKAKTTRIILEPRGEFRRILDKHDKMDSSVEEAEIYFETLRREFGSVADLSSEAAEPTVNFSTTRELDKALLHKLQDSVRLSPYSSVLDPAVMFETVPGLTQGRWLDELNRYGGSWGDVIFESSQPYYVKTFLELWMAHGEREMHAFLSWITVQTAALYSNRRLLDNFYGREDSVNVYHGAFCLSKAYLLCGRELFREYYDQLFSERARNSAQGVVADTRQAFTRRLNRWPQRDPKITVVRDWYSPAVPIEYFDPRSRQQPLCELQPHATMSSLGDMGSSLVDNWHSPTVSHSDLHYVSAAETIEYAEWFVLLPGHDLAVLPYALTFPSFDESGIRSMNQGGLGSYVADALSRLFLYSYRQSPNGVYFLRSFECARNSSGPPDGPSVRRTLQLLRTLAIEVSLDAYLYGQSPEGDARLEGFKDYGGAALFFIASCYARCLGSDSTPPFSGGKECDEPFRNVEGFANAFGCEPGTPMNPAEKCTLM